jgi:osmotically inducible protein OsmC
MALTALLTGSGHAPKSVATTAAVHLESVPGGFAIAKIELVTVAEVPGLTADAFAATAKTAKENCPISKALAAVPIELTATLAG